MFECFFPDEYLDSAYAVDYEKLYQQGYRGVLFDIDNTLVPHGTCRQKSQRAFSEVEKAGLFLLSGVQ